MTDQQIIDNNKLIAEFMSNNTIELLIPFEYELDEELPTSGKICTADTAEEEVRLEINEGIVAAANVMLKFPNYNTDWNWLMPVVEKMNKIVDATNYGHNIGIRYAQIKPIYKSVVEFIKWYNKEVK